LIYLKRGVKLYNNTIVSNVSFDGKATIEPYCRFIGEPEIKIGHDFYANAHCHFLGDIKIGDNVMIGPKTIIWSRDHGTVAGELMNVQNYIDECIEIESNVWIGANVTILKGVKIGTGAVIGAGSVVTKSIPSDAIAAGNPALVKKYRS